MQIRILKKNINPEQRKFLLAARNIREHVMTSDRNSAYSLMKNYGKVLVLGKFGRLMS